MGCLITRNDLGDIMTEKERWISVEERLPEFNKMMLLCCSVDKEHFSYYAIGLLGIDGEWYVDRGVVNNKITHWCEIPECPLPNIPNKLVPEFNVKTAIINPFNKQETISDDTINEYFEKTYAIYPRKVSKEQARKTYAHKLVGLDVEGARKVANTIYKCLEKQLVVWGNEKDGEGRLQEFLPHFSTWLNDNFADSQHYKRSRRR